MPRADLPRLPDHVKVVNCATCKAELVTTPADAERYERSRVAGRVKGRPFCAPCLRVSDAGVSGLAGGMPGDRNSPSPWLENAQRAAEESP